MGADPNRQLDSLKSCLPGASQGSEVTLLNITRQRVSSRVCALYQLSQTHSEHLSGGLTKTKEKFKDKTAAADQGKQVEPWGHRTNPKAVLSLGPRNKPASPRPRARRARPCRGQLVTASWSYLPSRGRSCNSRSNCSAVRVPWMASQPGLNTE